MATMGKPILIFVPGMWEGVTVFSSAARILQEQGYETKLGTLPAPSDSSSGKPSLESCINSVRGLVEPEVNLGRNVVLICHSVGGVIGPAAIKGLTRKERSAESLEGGVAMIAFICAVLFREGTAPAVLPIFGIQGDDLLSKSPGELLCSDIIDEAASKKWLDLMMPIPATDRFTEIKHAGWKDTPCSYLMCENDKVVPLPMQEMFAKLCDAAVQRCDAGHMVPITQPTTLVKFIAKTASSIS